MTTKEDDEDGKDHGFNVNFFRRFWRLQHLLFPGVFSLPLGLFSLLLLVALLDEFIIYGVGLIPSGFYQVLGEKDLPGFINQTLRSVGIILAVAVNKAIKTYISQVLNLTWRQLLTRAVHRLYFTDINYYQLNVLDKFVDNPDQRITADINILCLVFSSVAIKVVVSPFTIAYYSYKAYVGTGWVGPTSCFLFFIVGTFVNKLLMSPIVAWVVRNERREGDFRYKHMQIRSNAESLAFLTGARLEESKTNNKLDLLLTTQHSLYGRQFFLNLAVNMFDYLGSIISYLALAVPIFSGRYDGLSSAELSALISQNAFVCIYLISTFSTLVDLSSSVTQLAGVTHRVSELIERLQQLYDRSDAETPGDLKVVSVCKKNSVGTMDDMKQEGYLMEGVAFKAPGRSEDLVKELYLHLRPGESLLITGSSSAGKTSLLRLLRGLWKLNRGTLTAHCTPGPCGVLFLPQKPYLTDGTLREQITFPLSVDLDLIPNDETEELLSYLHKMKLDGLMTRIGGLDRPAEWNWYDVLSPGEMQRLSFIRLLYHKPAMAFLDEATSALDMEMEQLLYSAAVDKGITLISVGHRESLRAFHKNLLHLKGDGSWTLEPMRPHSQELSS
ncbi:ABC protein, subfamily ABCD [Daphnia magna]|uniref:ABC protein, subfamily ABCD n=2 Tax=Daphnia magna TaxID=35525 RepID=A0A165ABA9_9CRUS|nr:hypothetical protein OUZ56_028927 [Daphnia magna]KZS17405.1 ABC protein, subfamily ABCD [Daphnia magna]